MRGKNILWWACLITASFLTLSPVLVNGDIYIKKTKHTDLIIKGKKDSAKDEEGGAWIAKNKFRADEGDKTTIIVRLDLKKIYIINHQTKTYSEADIPVDLEKIISPQAKQMMEIMEVSAKVIDTDESEKMKKWKCKKYLIKINASMMEIRMHMTQELWVSKKIGIKLKLYEKYRREILALNPMIENIIDEIQKIEGYPVITKFSMSIMGREVKTYEEVVSVEKKDAPAGTYDVPQGYTKTDFNPFAQKERYLN